jgi:hypothetical protein
VQKCAKYVTSPVRYFREDSSKKEQSLEGWYVCNGALASRERDFELFAVLRERAGRGDGLTTFALPFFPIKYSPSGQLLSGTAICPRESLGMVAEVKPFQIDSNI